MKRLLLLILFLVSNPVYSQDTACYVGTSTTQIYFGNGINNSLAQARFSRNGLVYAYRVKRNLLDEYPEEKFNFVLAYNHSRGFARDVLEVINQKVDETGGLTASELLYLTKLSKKAALAAIKNMSTATGGGRIIVSVAVEAVDRASDAYLDMLEEDSQGLTKYYEQETENKHIQKYTSDLEEGKRIVVVSHSQGNLFANNAVREVLSRYPEHSSSIGIVGVASPAGTLVADNRYVTAHDDRVIDSLRITHDVLDSNLDNDPGFFDDPRDIMNHGFMTAYLASELTAEYTLGNTLESRGVINDIFLGLIRNLSFPLAELGDGAIVVTLEWGGNPDVDLHIFEPNGEHVFYRNLRGDSGYLDRDDTDGRGPEHYYVACETLEEGVYQVGVNYYSGVTQETARVQITTADGRTQSVSAILDSPRGSSGNSAPLMMASISVTQNEQGEYTYDTSLR